MNVSSAVPLPEAYVALRSLGPVSSRRSGVPVTYTVSSNTTATLILESAPYAAGGSGEYTRDMDGETVSMRMSDVPPSDRAEAGSGRARAASFPCASLIVPMSPKRVRAPVPV